MKRGLDRGLLYFEMELWVIKKKFTIMKQARIVHEVILGKVAFGVCGNVKLFNKKLKFLIEKPL